MIYKNKKTGHLYSVMIHGKVINTTNNVDGQIMISYFKIKYHNGVKIVDFSIEFVREKKEFYKKFVKV